MFQSYLRLLLKKKEFVFSFLFMLAISLGLFLYDCFLQFGADAGAVLSADKLFVGRENDNPLYIILQFILPLIIVLPFSDIALYEKNTNISPVVISRGGQKAYFNAQLLVSGISAWLVIFVPFFINFILDLVAFPYQSVNDSLFVSVAIDSTYYSSLLDLSMFQKLFSINVYLYNLFYLFLLSLFCGLCAMFTYCISYFIKGNRIFLNFLLFLINNFLIIISQFIGVSIAPFDYLFSLSSMTKLNWFFYAMFAFLIFAIAILSPICKKKLRNLR